MPGFPDPDSRRGEVSWRALTPTGTLLFNSGGSPGTVIGPMGSLFAVLAVNGFVRQRLRPLWPAQKRAELLAVTGLIDAGTLTPVLGRTYSLADTAEGIRHVEAGQTRGKVIITMS